MRHSREGTLLISVQASEKGAPVVVYDLQANDVDEELTAYGLYMSGDRLLKASTVVGAIYQVARLKTYLREKEPALLSDLLLKEYRTRLLEEAKTRSRGTRERAINATVNATLGAAYDWIWWLQATRRVPQLTIGPHPCAVKSEEIRSTRYRKISWSKPLLLRNGGRSSSKKLPGFVPTDQRKGELLEYFHDSTQSYYLAKRNALMLMVADRVGLRLGSVCSLSARDFDRERLDASAFETIDVVPRKQKFSYENSFEIPLDLAYEICSFIEGPREGLIKGKRLESSQIDEVFLSEKTGLPLKPRSVSSLFSKAMRELGAPKGAAFHAWRHKFVQDEVDREIAYRLEKKLDISDDSVKGSVSMKVGHKHPDSIQPYLLSYHTRSKRRSR